MKRFVIIFVLLFISITISVAGPVRLHVRNGVSGSIRTAIENNVSQLLTVVNQCQESGYRPLLQSHSFALLWISHPLCIQSRLSGVSMANYQPLYNSLIDQREGLLFQYQQKEGSYSSYSLAKDNHYLPNTQTLILVGESSANQSHFSISCLSGIISSRNRDQNSPIQPPVAMTLGLFFLLPSIAFQSLTNII